MIRSINPFTHELIEEFQYMDQSDINTCIESAQEAFYTWQKCSFEQRADVLLGIANDLKENKHDLARLMTLEVGKLYTEAVAEIQKCALVCEYYAHNAREFLNNTRIESDASTSFVTYQPLGVVLGIMPWNFPFWQVFRFAAPTLMAGNSVLVKHAPNVPQCAIEIEKIFQRNCKLDIYHNLMVDVPEIKPILEHHNIKAVSLTGSERAGASVASIAGANIKKSVLELGGSDACIILNDADLDLAIETAVKSRMINNGQSCIATKRLIIQSGIYNKAIEKCITLFGSFKYGDPFNSNTDYSVLAREDLAKNLEEQVKKSVKLGARIECGGKRNKTHFEPAILTGVKPGMPAYEEELFGPVLTCFRVETIEAAIQIANDSPYGLGGSVWTSDEEKGRSIAESINTGAMFVNGLVKSDPRLPFGGINNSGFGRELGKQGIMEFVNAKTIWIR